MARLRVRNEILKAVGMFMLEKGKVLEKHAYDGFGNDVPIRSGMALNHFGSWSRLLSTLEGFICGVFIPNVSPKSLTIGILS